MEKLGAMARRYSSTIRDAAARSTRRRILATARDLIISKGYSAFSVTSLARAADVSPQTIYNAVGSKAHVLKACYDVVLAGDDERIPMSSRPAFRALGEAETPEKFVEAYARWTRVIYEHVGPLLGAVLRPGGGADAAEFAATIDNERRMGTTQALTAYRRRFAPPQGEHFERVIDQVWTLNSPEVFDRLVQRCGWTIDDYQAWLARQLRCALLYN